MEEWTKEKKNAKKKTTRTWICTEILGYGPYYDRSLMSYYYSIWAFGRLTSCQGSWTLDCVM